MTLRISQFAVVCGLGLLTLPGVVQAQAPRYQSPLSVPNAPQPVLTLPVTQPITPNGTVVEDVVVHVNDQIISRSDVERAEQQLAEETRQTGVSAADVNERQKNLLRDMIDKQLLLSRGKELGINADADVIRRLDEIRKQNHLDTMEDLEKAARQQGVSFEDFKAGIRDSVITQQVVRDEVGRRLQITQGQEQAYYDAHKQEFTQPEQIKLSEILIPTAADADDAAVAQAKAKAESIEAKLKAGSKFEDLAEAFSGGPTADKGGDLGLYKRGALAKVLEDQTFDLKAGEWTAPIRTRQGFVILKVTDHVSPGVPPLKEVEPQIQEAMYSEQMQPALRAYLTKLREEAYIDIRAGYVDSGASAKQTKPVFTAYAPPVAKKKTVQQKKRFDRGTKFSTAAKTTAAPVATPAVAVTSPTTTTTTKNGKAAKPAKVKREKVRFGQAPRNSLPAGPEETASGSDVGAGAASASAAPSQAAAPGTAIAPLETGAQESSSDVGPNPLVATAPVVGKTRMSDRAKVDAAAKKTAKVKKVKEKAAAAPAPASAEEKATQQTQAAPLGLNGDTAKKKKKKKVKGAKKERLQDKPPAPKAAAPEETPSKAPDRGTPLEGVHGTGTPAPKPSDKTTLPPATAPPASNPPDGGQPPATPGSPIPTPPPQ
ncbi:peptidylprolyl isomerase [Tunturiibacter gelidoferens]|uniref:peptidylprolyl isomerase n=1 Tax=Tunturiibacter lichenicola TaxID=2051959 RepID=A0A7Y9T9A4_9BACT|nr:peptidyl-prolyl cis-trans isomerase [Edaphobacter lichenicola]NYF51225.1 peptidyl-prolyl cis-trans isomerase SurA [Edaphobacter lichenicola]